MRRHCICSRSIHPQWHLQARRHGSHYYVFFQKHSPTFRRSSPHFPAHQSLKIGSISPCFLNHKVKQKSLYKIIERAPLPQLLSPRLKSPYLHHWTTALLMASDRSPAIEGLSPLQPRCGPFSPWTYPAEEKRWDNMG